MAQGKSLDSELSSPEGLRNVSLVGQACAQHKQEQTRVASGLPQQVGEAADESRARSKGPNSGGVLGWHLPWEVDF